MNVEDEVAYFACKFERITRDEPSVEEVSKMRRMLQWFLDHLCMHEYGWISIDSAPKDGTRILVFAERHGYESITIASYVIDGCGENGIWAMPGPKCTPTHWMPLPAAPTLAGESS